ncbi:MAG TPA: TIR domain-containing protein [Polyangia bacterium]|nr:TIR domain-containing protein [Polyangia bacterium]
MFRPLRAFISYVRADEQARRRLDVHLAPLRREGLLAPWHDEMSEAGATMDDDIARNLTEADLVLLLVSADFLAADDLLERELKQALARHAAGAARVIPIVVRPSDFGKTPLARLKPLPRDGHPVSAWSDPEAAWLDVARGIRQVVETLAARLAASSPPVAPAVAQPAPPGGRIRVVFLGADPVDATRNEIGREVHEIDRHLRESAAGRGFELVQEWAARPMELQAILLRHQPHILHFSGHGSQAGQLVLEDPQGKACMVPVPVLGQLFSLWGEGIRCVVLNACYAESQAEALRQHVACVVGMKLNIGNGAAVAFASAFYLALGYGQSVQKAFEAGRVQIAMAGSPDADVPVLLTRPGVDASRVFFTNGSAAADR